MAVAPQLSARVSGAEYRLLVQPLDPIDPFRGAYVTLDYPGLQRPGDSPAGGIDDTHRGRLFIPLLAADGLWEGGDLTRQRPVEGPYLACDDAGWVVRCGIESWFLPQDEAAALERALADEGAVATIKVDGHGNAAIVALDPR